MHYYVEKILGNSHYKPFQLLVYESRIKYSIVGGETYFFFYIFVIKSQEVLF